MKRRLSRRIDPLLIIGRMLQSMTNVSLKMTTNPDFYHAEHTLLWPCIIFLPKVVKEKLTGYIVWSVSFRLHGILIWAMPSPINAEETFENHFGPQRSLNGHNAETSELP
jgi:hypothetical protein